MPPRQPTLENAFEATSDGKWFDGISRHDRLSQVASRVLDVRLKMVCRTLPAAAEKSDEDVEHVHRLRIAVRRAMVAVKCFSKLMEKAESQDWHDRLRRVRLAADEARNWDILCKHFAHGRDVPLEILSQAKAQRREVQAPIREAHREINVDGWESKINSFVESIAAQTHGLGKHRLQREAPKLLAPVVKKFFKSAKGDLSSDEGIHALRIAGKKLRYAIEMFCEAFPTALRKKLYPQLTLYQDLLGTAHDHYMSTSLLRGWLSQIPDPKNKAFLKGMLVADELAARDLRTSFLAIWTPELVSDLERKFRDYR